MTVTSSASVGVGILWVSAVSGEDWTSCGVWGADNRAVSSASPWCAADGKLSSPLSAVIVMRNDFDLSSCQTLSVDNVLCVSKDGGGPEVVSTPYELCDAGARRGEGTVFERDKVTLRCPTDGVDGSVGRADSTLCRGVCPADALGCDASCDCTPAEVSAVVGVGTRYWAECNCC